MSAPHIAQHIQSSNLHGVGSEHTVKGQDLAKMDQRALAGKVGHLLELTARVGGKQRSRRLERQSGSSKPCDGIPINLCLVCVPDRSRCARN